MPTFSFNRSSLLLLRTLHDLGESPVHADRIASDANRWVDDAGGEFALAVELGNVALWRHDLATDRLYFNERGHAVYGVSVSADGVPLDELRCLIHPDDLARVVDSARQALSSDMPVDIEARYRGVDGSWRHLLTRRVVERSATGEAVAFVGVAMDVTEHRNALASLRDADERSALIARSVGIGIWEADCTTRLERWDDQMFRLRGLEPRPQPPAIEERLALVHPDDRQRVLDAHSPCGSALPVAYEFRVCLADGSQRWLASRSVALPDDAGDRQRRVGVNWDVTDAKNAELLNRQTALVERERQARSLFLSRMSHELRTPLNAVLGFTQLLQLEAGGSGPGSRSSRLEHVRAAGEHLKALIDDMLDLSSLESGQMRLDLRPVVVADVVAEAVAAIQSSMAGAGRVRLRHGPLPGVAHADPVRLLRVLLGVLRNAVACAPAGAEIMVQSRLSADRLVLGVHSSGHSLDAGQLGRLFEPFSRSGGNVDGNSNGIGLTVVEALVHSMGGTLVATSSPEAGTLFDIDLPSHIAAAVEPVPGPDSAAVPAGWKRSGQLLYIEDNEVNVLLVEQMVGLVDGLKIASEPTGSAGVARALSLRPDLILIDLQLPDFDGFEVLRQLRAAPSTAATVCIALSANAMPDDIARGLAAGFSDYWTKPIHLKPFLASLERLFPLQPAAIKGEPVMRNG